ncbi:MAG TPA: aldo/keto reductase [Thermoanaerobaculia bacterium]|jgi:diketogulonate reductase-like aldo/keto reductase
MDIPTFLYGTAWKEDETARLTRLALDSGFRGIDTANQRKHYFEAAVGEGIAGAIEAGVVRRDELFLQTKFTYRGGQDHRLPYDPAAAPATQVRQSFASSLEHLRVETLDSYVLHGPSRRSGLSELDVTVWRAMEELQRTGQTRHLGISNVALDQLEMLWSLADVKPQFVQNRCYASTRWDADVRTFCRAHGIIYQGFSLLTANARELRSVRFREIVARSGGTAAQVVFRFALQVGMLPLTGTTDAAHMREDLASPELTLPAEDVAAIESIAA